MSAKEVIDTAVAAEDAAETVKAEVSEAIADAEAKQKQDEFAEKVAAGMNAAGDIYQGFSRKRAGRVMDRLVNGIADVFKGVLEGKKAIEEGRAKELVPGPRGSDKLPR